MSFIFILAPFLGLTTFIFKLLMVLGGAVIMALGFWLLSSEKLKKSTTDQEVQEIKELQR